MVDDSAALAQLRELYAQLPTIQCRGMCANSCGPIDMTDVERRRLVDLGVHIEVFTAEAAAAWAEGARLDCPALGPFRNCTVYADRPLICRLWGVAESMPCPHGCQPSKVLTDAECYELIFTAMQIGGHRKFGDTAAIREQYQRFADDPDLGPLFARFIRGDRAVEKEIWRLLQRRVTTDPTPDPTPRTNTVARPSSP